MTGPQIIVLATPVFFLLIGIEFLVGWKRGRNTYRLSDALNSIGLGIMSQLVGVLTKLMAIGIYTVVYTHASLWKLPADALWVWLVGLLLYDLCYYWHHRLGHTVALFWAAHVVHHQSEDYNLSTALRQPSSGWVGGWLFYLPMAVLGFPPLVFGTVALIDLLYQYWVHTQQIGKLGWFDRWFCAPSNHRVHPAVRQLRAGRRPGALRVRHARSAAQLESAVGEPAQLLGHGARRVARALMGRQAAGVVQAPGMAAGRCRGALAQAGVRHREGHALRPAAGQGSGHCGDRAFRRAAERDHAVPVECAHADAGAADGGGRGDPRWAVGCGRDLHASSPG
jgi:hypothetical protein